MKNIYIPRNIVAKSDLIKVISTDENPRPLSGNEKRLIAPHKTAHKIINNSPEYFLILRKGIEFTFKKIIL